MLIPTITENLPAAFMLAQIFSCTPHPVPAVNVVFNNMPHTVNNAVSLEELQRVQSNTHIRKTSAEHFTTVGTTESNIVTTMDAGFQIASNQLSGDACMSVARVNINITYTPQVLILRDYRPGSCRYQTTYEHELRHVSTDILAIHDFIPVIRNTVQAVLNQFPTQGPYPSQATDAKQKNIQQTLELALQGATDQMTKTRDARQQLVDTHEEYMRLSAACPHEPMGVR